MSDFSFHRPKSSVLFLKILAISGPIFAICVGLATYVLWKENTRREQELFAASIGNAAARTSATLRDNFDALEENGLVDDFVSMLAANPSIRCAELVFAEEIRAIHPRVVGCNVQTAEVFYDFPVLDDQNITLKIGVSEAYLRAKINAFAQIAFFGYVVSFFISMLSSWIAFKYIVGRPLDDLVDDLVKALKASKEANLAKMRFLANISHEIRTPMNGIMGVTQILKTTPLDQKQEQLVDVMQTSSNNMLGIIEDILDFSKLNNQSVTLEKSYFSLEELIEECTELPAISASKKGLEFTVEIKNETGADYFGDRKRLGQVVTNLIGNALKFTEAGSIKIRVQRVSNLTIEVIDTGIGVSACNIDKIFEPFSQEDESTTRKFGGTGLGLAICKDLIQKMNGTISVSSEPNAGSIFKIELPDLPA